MGISKGQGWHFGQPMDGVDAAGLLSLQANGTPLPHHAEPVKLPVKAALRAA